MSATMVEGLVVRRAPWRGERRDVGWVLDLLRDDNGLMECIGFPKSLNAPPDGVSVKVWGNRGKKWLFAVKWERMKTPHFRFNGPDYDPALDRARLTGQILRIFKLMSEGEWRTLGEIEAATGDPQASISAQLRHMRKDRFGGHTVLKRRRGEGVKGLWEYKLIVKRRET